MTDNTELKPCRFNDVHYGDYGNYVTIKRDDERDICVDACMVPELKDLWRKGIETLECCCGHGKRNGYIAVSDSSRPAMEELGYKPDPTAPHCYLCKTHVKKQPLNDAELVEVLKEVITSSSLSAWTIEPIRGVMPEETWSAFHDDLVNKLAKAALAALKPHLGGGFEGAASNAAIELCSDSLYSKWGFCDGDILSDLLWNAPEDLEHQTLFALIKKYLLPRMEGVDVDFIITHHNPIRAVDMDNRHPEVTVSVSHEYIMYEFFELLKPLKPHLGGGNNHPIKKVRGKRKCAGFCSAGLHIGSPCGASAKYKHDGKWWCKNHLPQTPSEVE